MDSILGCVACVVAVFGARPAIVETACAVPVKSPVTSPVTSPTKVVEVIEVAPVTTPASTAIVPSNNILAPEAGSSFICPSASNVKSESLDPSPTVAIVKSPVSATVNVA